MKKNRTTHDDRFPDNAFSRDDENDDREFYSTDRIVPHLDSTANQSIQTLIGSLVTGQRPRILDLMASWDSHLPASMQPGTVTGLGLNETELSNNRQLTDSVLHDLNADPVLPFADRSFDAVICTVSVDYLTHPVEVVSEVRRVLEPGGLFLVIFSNRFFPEKVVSIWRDSTENERVRIVERYFELGGGFTTPRAIVSRGKVRPDDDRYAHMGLPSDPVYAVYAERGGGSGSVRRAEGFQPYDSFIDPEVLRERRRNVAVTLRCPHCEKPLSKWLVPQTPFTEWTSEHQYVCFNDNCSYYVRGWEVFSGQCIPGSYRFMFDPDTQTSHSIPVLTPTTLRASIV